MLVYRRVYIWPKQIHKRQTDFENKCPKNNVPACVPWQYFTLYTMYIIFIGAAYCHANASGRFPFIWFTEGCTIESMANLVLATLQALYIYIVMLMIYLYIYKYKYTYIYICIYIIY